jgi:hypothetical protein
MFICPNLTTMLLSVSDGKHTAINLVSVGNNKYENNILPHKNKSDHVNVYLSQSDDDKSYMNV